MNKEYEVTKPYTDEEFVIAWMDAYSNGRTARSVADLLGQTAKHVYYRVDKLRSEGVDLPNFRERIIRRKRNQIDNLNDLIKSHTGAI